ncbi:unnamed protein product [Dibothriocephalus latus]|uniref:Amidase domain-containing protein n=1 Tax=Dibothriocephalus latus TaxID=60516 RepID=A0A3P7LCG2_DIBLA|nr:unnamed protein product [Dibothriocephalus latus]
MGIGSCFCCLAKVFDFASFLYVCLSLDLDVYFVRLVLNPAAYYLATAQRSFIFRIGCPLWITSRLCLTLYRVRGPSKKLNNKLKRLTEVQQNMSSKLLGLQTPMQNVDKVIGLRVDQLRHHIIEKRDLTTLDVVEAFQVHALQLLGAETGCISEIVFDADVTAILADQGLSKGTPPKSPLHGIPVSLVNCIPIKGEDCTGSLVFRAKHNAACDSKIVAALKEAGAVPILLSNISPLPCQLLTSSKLYGTCKHPTHPDRAVGGSAGAEAILLLRNASVLGFGVDTFGDVRISAAFCGVVGFKPTSNRLSYDDVQMSVRPPFFLSPVVSPLAMDVASITNVMESLCSAPVLKTDPALPLCPFTPLSYSKKLTIGFYTSLPELIPCVPSVDNCLAEVKSILQSLGHTVVEVQLPKPDEPLLLTLSYLAADDSYWRLIVRQNMGDALSKADIFRCGLAATPYWARSVLGWLLKLQQGTSCARTQKLLSAWKNELPAGELENRVRHYREKFEKLWEEEELDLLIGPAAPSPALLTSSSAALYFMNMGYSLIFNLLDLPAGVLPLGNVTKSDVEATADLAAKEPSSSLFGQLLRQQNTSEGLPLAVQLVGKPWTDDLILHIMTQLENKRH